MHREVHRKVSCRGSRPLHAHLAVRVEIEHADVVVLEVRNVGELRYVREPLCAVRECNRAGRDAPRTRRQAPARQNPGSDGSWKGSNRSATGHWPRKATRRKDRRRALFRHVPGRDPAVGNFAERAGRSVHRIGVDVVREIVRDVCEPPGRIEHERQRASPAAKGEPGIGVRAPEGSIANAFTSSVECEGT